MSAPLDEEDASLLSTSELLLVDAEANGERLDHFLCRHYPLSRSALHKLIGQALVLVNEVSVKAGYTLRPGNRIQIAFPEPEPTELLPEPVDFPILYEDEAILVLNKPPGLVVHPGSGTQGKATLAHGLLFHCQHLPMAATGRPGLVHRLDKDTSGLMVVAKTEATLRRLMADFKERKIRKTYQALLVRCPPESVGRIVAPIGRHPVQRQKMAVVEQGRYATSTWQVTERFANGWVLAQIGIETGRTHQIRVHMASLHCPVIGDALYGGASGANSLNLAKRQMLHAWELEFLHPANGQVMQMQAPLWPDMQEILANLRGENK